MASPRLTLQDESTIVIHSDHVVAVFQGDYGKTTISTTGGTFIVRETVQTVCMQLGFGWRGGG